jgi:D,D-heptose 1,7-bisphosphate phosphatase
VFLDRDGVVNELVYYEEHGIIDSPFTVAQFRLLPGVIKAVQELRDAGYTVVLVSNQPGIAKGHMSREAFNKIKERMKEELTKGGTCLDGEYYCLHHPEAVVAELRANCECRKPKPGLLLQAARDLNIDLSTSCMVGDGLTDVVAGKKAGCRTILLGRMKCDVCRMMDDLDARPDGIATHLTEAARIIIGKDG